MINSIFRRLICFSIAVLLALVTRSVAALGVPANTAINNTATVDYEIGGVSGSVNATSSFTVVELLDVELIWQDAANVTSISPQNNVAIRYTLTNTGNGIDQYLLNADGILPGDNFDIAPPDLGIWIDNGDDIWSSLTDTFYDGSNGPVLNGGVAGGDAVTVFIVANVGAGLTVGDLANVRLTATSMTADTAGQTGNTGAEIAGAGDGGVNANVGLSGAEAEATSNIEIISAGVSINKSFTVIDTLGGNDPHTGATLRYTLDVLISGINVVNNLVIVDPVPSTTTFTAGSITLNGVAQSDSQDAPADYSDFNVSNTNAVTVDLSEAGSVSITPPANFVIEFEVTID